MSSIEGFFQEDKFDTVDAIELAGDDGDFLIAEFGVEGARSLVALVCVDAQSAAAQCLGIAGVEIGEGSAQPMAFDRRINDEGMHDKNVVVCHSDAPGRAGVFLTLHMVEDGGTDDGAFDFFHEEITACESSFSSGAG